MIRRSTTIRPAWALAPLAMLAGFVGCQAPQDKLIDRRFEQRRILDDLYATYGGGELAHGVQQEADGAAAEIKKDEGEGASVAAEIIGNLGQMALEMDRGAFESQCLAIGRGERPMILSPQAREFFTARENAVACRRAAKLHLQIRALEKELGLEPGEAVRPK